MVSIHASLNERGEPLDVLKTAQDDVVSIHASLNERGEQSSCQLLLYQQFDCLMREAFPAVLELRLSSNQRAD
jgi:hypothetical protein